MATEGSNTLNYGFFLPNDNSDGWGSAMRTFVVTVDRDLTRAVTFANQAESRLNTVDGQIAGLGIRLSGVEGGISALDLRLDAFDTFLASFGSRLGGAETALTALGGRVNTLEGGLNALGARVGVLETGAATQGGEINTLKTSVAGLTTRAAAAEEALTALTARVTAAEGSVTSLAGQVASKLSTVATGSGLLGNGTSGNPLRLDPSAIPAPGTSGLTAVAHDSTLTGAGTPGDPLKVNLAILPSGFEVVETSSAAWTVPNDGVLPRFAYLYLQPPAGRWVVPVGFSGLSEGDDASPGLTGKPCIVTRRLPDGDTYQTPTDLVKVTWIDFGSMTGPGPITKWTALTANDALVISTETNNYRDNYLDTYAVVRPAAAPAGSAVRVRGTTVYADNTGHVVFARLYQVVGGVRTLITTTQAGQISGYSFDVALASPPAGNWSLELELSANASQLGNDATATLHYNVVVEYLAP